MVLRYPSGRADRPAGDPEARRRHVPIHIEALRPLYPKLSKGGYLIIDDYVLPGCQAAVQDYRREHGISEKIVDIDGTGVYWQKQS